MLSRASPPRLPSQQALHQPSQAAQLDRLMAQALHGWARPQALSGQRIGVALSGGADSSAVLLAAIRCWPTQVHAAHVHHGLQAAAADFETHCTALCARLQVPLTVLRVQAQHAMGESPEARARQARYAALAGWALQHNTAHVLLGHHADDQVESVLLALSRGAGVAGLAGMAAQFERGGARFARPLLRVPAQAIRDWLRVQGLGWVEDPSNQDPRFTRNRIRQLLPHVYAAFPAMRETAARSASLCAQAAELLDERADADLHHLHDLADLLGPRRLHDLADSKDLATRAGAAPTAANAIEPAPMHSATTTGIAPGTPAHAAAKNPSISGLQALSTMRQANAIRRWLRQTHHTTPSQAQLDALLVQLAACRTRGHRIALKVGSGFVVRVGAQLHWQPQP